MPSISSWLSKVDYKWIALSNTTLGVLMASIDGSIVLISIPDIFRGIGVNPLLPENVGYLLWTLMGYLVVTSVLLVSFGRISDMFGRVKMYNLGFAIFTLASVLLSVVGGSGSGAAMQIIVFTATPEPEPVCPAAAPDGHPMRWYDYLGCQDIYWKSHYCSQGGSCNTCTGRQGCIWNGAACVPCSAPSCSYFCPRAGGAGGAGGGAAAPQARVDVRQKEIPAPSPQAPVSVRLPGEATPQPTAEPGSPTASPGATATPAATPVPTPPMQCGYFKLCSSCANAPKKDNESQCGWSVFTGACLDGKAWDALNNVSLKAGWITNEKDCPNETQRSYCFQYTDCFSCAGSAGVKRECQWSVKDNACLPYNPLGKFRNNDTSEENDIILPAACPSHDCSQYSECGQCQENDACIWDFDAKECNGFKGQKPGESMKLSPGTCGGKATATPTPSPIPCPKGCDCDATSRVLKCGGSAVNDSGFINSVRAAANAGASASMDLVGDITFSQPAGGNASFVITGRREGNLLFFFPISFDVTATVNAQTGALEKTDQPWWSFFVA